MYASTRHNLGFLVVEELAASLNASFKEVKQFNANVAKAILNGKCIHLIEPLTYMNLSGWAVRQYLDYYKLSIAQTVVICDDIALDFGAIRLRSKGSAGGHNGLKSIISHFGTDDFVRLRMGIGDYRDREPLSDYVLSSFTAEELGGLSDFVKRGAAVLKELTADPITQVMNRVNTK
ncbi:MAG: aminoacyl-tRNA hydrolase [Parachlamydiaceae bacterium]|nr:aminoacyl-tRNA hydrolase [Parachlamydiaceae bacterium]